MLPVKQEGIVVHGKALGRVLGFRTANIDILPKESGVDEGVYAAFVWIDEVQYQAAAVVHFGREQVEFHILDFDQDIYGKKLRAEVLWYCAAIEAFDDMDALKVYIRENVEKVRNYFNQLTINN